MMGAAFHVKKLLYILCDVQRNKQYRKIHMPLSKSEKLFIQASNSSQHPTKACVLPHTNRLDNN